ACGFNVNNGRELCSLANRSNLAMNRRPRAASLLIAQSVISRHPSKSALRACETAAASGAVRPSHSVKRPDRLRGLAPQSCFVAARAVKQGRVKIGKAQETLGEGAGLRPWSERRARGRRGQRFLAAVPRVVSSVRAKALFMAIGAGGSLERPRLSGS